MPKKARPAAARHAFGTRILTRRRTPTETVGANDGGSHRRIDTRLAREFGDLIGRSEFPGASVQEPTSARESSSRTGITRAERGSHFAAGVQGKAAKTGSPATLAWPRTEVPVSWAT
jgi:hypothetical protein